MQRIATYQTLLILARNFHINSLFVRNSHDTIPKISDFHFIELQRKKRILIRFFFFFLYVTFHASWWLPSKIILHKAPWQPGRGRISMFGWRSSRLFFSLWKVQVANAVSSNMSLRKIKADEADHEQSSFCCSKRGEVLSFINFHVDLSLGDANSGWQRNGAAWTFRAKFHARTRHEPADLIGFA